MAVGYHHWMPGKLIVDDLMPIHDADRVGLGNTLPLQPQHPVIRLGSTRFAAAQKSGGVDRRDTVLRRAARMDLINGDRGLIL